jgi:hypothetical protein
MRDTLNARKRGAPLISGHNAEGVVMDAIEFLKKDHRLVESLFEEFDKLGEKALKSKAKVVAKILHELELHAAAEERDFYPNFRIAAKEEEDMVLEAFEEHHVVKFLIHELKTMDPQEERYTAKVTVLKELIQHHVKEEEEEMFIEARKVLTKAQLSELTERMEQTKARFEKQAPPRVRVTMLDAEKSRQQPK